MGRGVGSIDTLFKPIKINSVTLSNRYVMGPVAALDPQADGRPSEQTTKFLAARARGGVGMVIVGNTIATKRGFDESPYKPLLRLDLEEYLPELKRVAEDVHEAGAAIIGEAMAAFGRMGRPTKTRPSIAAS